MSPKLDSTMPVILIGNIITCILTNKQTNYFTSSTNSHTKSLWESHRDIQNSSIIWYPFVRHTHVNEPYKINRHIGDYQWLRWCSTSIVWGCFKNAFWEEIPTDFQSSSNVDRRIALEYPRYYSMPRWFHGYPWVKSFSQSNHSILAEQPDQASIHHHNLCQSRVGSWLATLM